jgi:hypothetical protein
MNKFGTHHRSELATLCTLKNYLNWSDWHEAIDHEGILFSVRTLNVLILFWGPSEASVELKNYSDNSCLRLFLSTGEGLYTSPTVFFYSEFGLDRAGILLYWAFALIFFSAFDAPTRAHVAGLSKRKHHPHMSSLINK